MLIVTMALYREVVLISAPKLDGNFVIPSYLEVVIVE